MIFFNNKFSMYFHNIYQNPTFHDVFLKFFRAYEIKENICLSNVMEKRIFFHHYKTEKAFLAIFDRGFKNNVYSERPSQTQNK